MSNLKEGFCHRSYALWKNGLNGLSFNPQFLRVWACQEGEKKVVYWCMPLLPLVSLWFFCIFFSFLSIHSLLSFSTSSSFRPLFLLPSSSLFFIATPFLLSLFFPFFFYLFFFLSLVPPSFLLFTVYNYPFLYYLLWWNLPFLPLNCFWLIMGVLPKLPTNLPTTQPLPLLWMC